jgi:hypothetical protein
VGLSWSLVEFVGDEVEVGFAEWGVVGSSWEVLAEQPIGVFHGAPLPGAVWVAEVDGHSGVDPEPGMLCQFGSLVPGQCSHQSVGESLDLSGDGGSDGFGASVVWQVQQHDEPAGPFHHHTDLGVAVTGADDEITLPVAGHRTILDLGSSLINTMSLSLPRPGTR